MANYCAKIENNVCVDVIVAEIDWVNANLSGEWIDVGGDPLTVGPGDVYDPTTKTFTTPSSGDDI